jgi:hypothetical protein
MLGECGIRNVDPKRPRRKNFEDPAPWSGPSPGWSPGQVNRSRRLTRVAQAKDRLNWSRRRVIRAVPLTLPNRVQPSRSPRAAGAVAVAVDAERASTGPRLKVAAMPNRRATGSALLRLVILGIQVSMR